MDTTYNVRLWKTETLKGKTRTSYRVRWRVGTQPFAETFATKALADSFRSDLVSAARKGEAFYVASGKPVSMERLARRLPWFDFARDYAAMKWPHLAANSRRNTARGLSTVTLAMLSTDRGRPPLDDLRRAMAGWAFNMRSASRGSPPVEIAAALKWLAANTRDVGELADAAVTRAVLDALSATVGGSVAAPATTQRKRGVLVNAVEYAVECGLLARNPITALPRKTAKAVKAVDRRVVVNPVQARALLAAVESQTPSGPSLKAFFGAMYYSALRPGEAANLRKSNLLIPERGWGDLLLTDSAPVAGSMWTDTGSRRDLRQLKHREKGETRAAPCPPELTALLHEHLECFGTDSHGRLFYGVRGGQVSESTYWRVWREARSAAFTPEEAASPLAERPYDLRHAAVSTWLNGGVEPTRVAEWAGHSVEVLLKVYAKCLDGQEDRARQRVEQALALD